MTNKYVYQISDNDFIQVVKTSVNIHQALTKLGLHAKGAAYKTFKQRCINLHINLSHFKPDKDIRKALSETNIKTSCKNNISRHSTLISLQLNPTTNANITWINKFIEQHNIDTSHWLGQGHLLNKTHNWGKSIPDEKVFIANSKFLNNTNIKKRLLKEKILEYKCYEQNCGIDSWHGQKLSLQLEHINGDHTDNRIENLTLLCPNCHSLTPTFCRGQKRINKTTSISVVNTTIQESGCLDCNKSISSSAKRCKSCSKKLQPKKIIWPDKYTLLEMLEQSSYLAVGKQLGVSDNAVRKHLKNSRANGRT